MPRPAPRVAPATSAIFPCKAFFVSSFANLGISVVLKQVSQSFTVPSHDESDAHRRARARSALSRVSCWKPQNLAHFPFSHHLGRTCSAALQPFCEFSDSHPMLNRDALARHGHCIHRTPDACHPFVALELLQPQGNEWVA